MLFYACLTFLLPASIAFPQAPPGSASEGASQAPVSSIGIYSDDDNNKLLGPWMNYVDSNDGITKKWTSPAPTEPPTIFPGATLSGFSAAMCSTFQALLCPKSHRFLILIHVVDWLAADDTLTEDAVHPGTFKAMNQVTNVTYLNSYWYFYQEDKAGNFHQLKPSSAPDGTYTLPDIYDVDNGFVISISRLKTTTTATNLVPPSIVYNTAVTTSLPNWLTGIETIISKMTGATIPTATATPASPKTAAGLPRLDYYHKALIQVQEFSALPIKRPFSISITATAAGRIPSTAEALAPIEPSRPGRSVSIAFDTANKPPTPPQLDCSALNPQGSCAFQASAAVQARDFVMFGIGVVPHGPSETDYSTNMAGVQTSTTSARNNFYGLVDFTPCPIRCTMKNWPYLQVGLPLTGAAWHAPYAGAAVSIPWPWLKKTLPLSFFAGTIVLKQQNASGNAYTNVRPLWGFEVPLSSLGAQIQAVTGNKKKGGG